MHEHNGLPWNFPLPKYGGTYMTLIQDSCNNSIDRYCIFKIGHGTECNRSFGAFSRAFLGIYKVLSYRSKTTPGHQENGELIHFFSFGKCFCTFYQVFYNYYWIWYKASARTIDPNFKRIRTVLENSTHLSHIQQTVVYKHMICLFRSSYNWENIELVYFVSSFFNVQQFDNFTNI